MDIAAAGVLAATIVSVLTSSRLVIDTGDATAALARSVGCRTLAHRAVAALECLAHRRADLLVVRGRYHRLYLRDRGHSGAVIQIPDLPPPTEPVSPERARRVREALNLGTALTVGFVGSLIWSRRLRRCYGWELIEALAILRDLPICGVVIGDGTGLAWLKQRASQLGVRGRIVFMGAVNTARIAEHLAVVDVCLSTQTDDLPGWVRTTGKLPLYLANRRFILATDVGEASWVLPGEMLVEYSGTLDRDYPARLAARLRDLQENRETLKLASIGPTIVERYFAPDAQSRRLLAEMGVPVREAG
jgi:glycosyltransferase involved in cell wall biosynthesis